MPFLPFILHFIDYFQQSIFAFLLAAYLPALICSTINMSDFTVVKVSALCSLFGNFLADLKKGDFTRIIMFGKLFNTTQQFILDFSGIEVADIRNENHGKSKCEIIEMYNEKFHKGSPTERFNGICAIRDVWDEIARQNRLSFMAENSVLHDNNTVRFDSSVHTTTVSSFSVLIDIFVIDVKKLCSPPKIRRKKDPDHRICERRISILTSDYTELEQLCKKLEAEKRALSERNTELLEKEKEYKRELREMKAKVCSDARSRSVAQLKTEKTPTPVVDPAQVVNPLLVACVFGSGRPSEEESK